MLGIFKKLKSESGMTALELVVVMGIFAAISSTVLFNYRNFSNNVALQNLAQDIALQIKRAQTDAVSGSQPIFQATSQQLIPPDWKPSYGIAFDLGGNNNNWNPASGDPHKGFVYYFNKDSTLDTELTEIDRDFFDFTQTTYGGCTLPGPESECLEEISVNSGDIIDMLCLDYNAISDTCDNPTTQLFISFTRPRPGAIIMDGAQDDGGGSPHENAFIRITSPSGTHKYISVWSSGYISIK